MQHLSKQIVSGANHYGGGAVAVPALLAGFGITIAHVGSGDQVVLAGVCGRAVQSGLQCVGTGAGTAHDVGGKGITVFQVAYHADQRTVGLLRIGTCSGGKIQSVNVLAGNEAKTPHCGLDRHGHAVLVHVCNTFFAFSTLTSPGPAQGGPGQVVVGEVGAQGSDTFFHLNRLLFTLYLLEIFR